VGDEQNPPLIKVSLYNENEKLERKREL